MTWKLGNILGLYGNNGKENGNYYNVRHSPYSPLSLGMLVDIPNCFEARPKRAAEVINQLWDDGPGAREVRV